jgi:hypothetical protein
MLVPSLATVAGPDEPTELEEHLSELVESSWVALDAETYSLTEHGASNLERLGEVVDSIGQKSTAGFRPPIRGGNQDPGADGREPRLLRLTSDRRVHSADDLKGSRPLSGSRHRTVCRWHPALPGGVHE